MSTKKIMQYGEGKFLRAFIDVIIQRANENLGYQKYVVNLVQPLEYGQLMDLLKTENFKYTVNEVNPSLGIDNLIKIECIADGIDPYREFNKYYEACIDSELTYIFSNTTESGIQYVKEEFTTSTIMTSFPGKVLQMLYFRFKELGHESTVTLIPCELIEQNALKLKGIIQRKAEENNLSSDFIDYIDNCKFYDTLVDRIVVGYQENEQNDPNYILCEPFLKFVIDADQIELIDDADHPGIILDDVVMHRELKVKILNGLHTALTPFAILRGVKYVHEIFTDDFFITKTERLLQEILQTIDLDNKKEYAEAIITRFKNPKLNHEFTSIMLNSLDKFVTRGYPAILQCLAQGELPSELLASLCAIVVQYKCGYDTNDQENCQMWEELSLTEPALALIKYKFSELGEYPEAIEYINYTVEQLRGEYEKGN